MSKQYLLGIDLGTTNIKGNIMDNEGNLISTASRPNHLIFPGPNMIEQDANEWWNNACEILKDMTAAAGEDIVKEIKGISISSQVISLLPLDKDGNTLRNAIIYQDCRSAAEVDYILEKVGFDNFVNIVGGQPSVAFLPNKILWFKNNEPELFAKTYRILQANGYLNYKLTGAMEMDLDCAGRCQCMEMATLKWSKEIGDVVGVDFNDILPQPKNMTDIIGYVTDEAAAATGLAAGIPVVAGASDAMASMYATGMTTLAEAGESSGTTSLVFVGADKPSRPDVPIVTRPCAISGMPYIFDGPIGSAGASVKWYLDNLGHEDKRIAEEKGISVFDYINEAALDIKPGSDGLMFFPYLVAGERAPLWNSHAKGMFIGMNLATTRNHFIRAVFEGTAFALRHVIWTMKESGADPKSIRITGGGSKSRTWNMIKASMLNMPVYILDEKSGDVPFGDVLIAGNAVGVFPDLTKAIKDMVQVKEIIEPIPEWVEAYNKLYPYYVKMYQHLDADLAEMKQTVDNI